MTETFSRWDSADYLRADEDMAVISRARGMTHLARD